MGQSGRAPAKRSPRGRRLGGRLTAPAASPELCSIRERRDGHLRRPDFFDAAKYPAITFASTSVARPSPTTGVVTADRTMHGLVRSVQVPVTVRFSEGGRGRFAGAFSVNRTDYGVSYNSRMNPIDNEVAVQFNMACRFPRAPGA